MPGNGIYHHRLGFSIDVLYIIFIRFSVVLFLQPGGVMINRAAVSKWGIEIGQVTLFFTKPEDGA